MNHAIYIHSAKRYNNSFKTSQLAYWGRIHLLMCKALGEPSLLLPAGEC